MGDVVQLPEAPGWIRGRRVLGDVSDGWAAMAWNKPHWFEFAERDDGMVQILSLCGRMYVGPKDGYLAQPGDSPRCKRCIAALAKR